MHNLTDESVQTNEFVPRGIKSKCMFKINKSGDKFWDDCGAWSGTHGKKTYLLEANLLEIRLSANGL